MAAFTIVVVASFLIGAAIGGALVYMYFAARLQQEKQYFADELHRMVEREERATMSHRIAA